MMSLIEGVLLPGTKPHRDIAEHKKIKIVPISEMRGLAGLVDYLT